MPPPSDNQTQIVMRIRVSDSTWLGKLAADLLRGDCLASAVDAETLEVLHPYAHDEREARTELAFFLRAWQSRHPQVDVTLA